MCPYRRAPRPPRRAVGVRPSGPSSPATPIWATCSSTGAGSASSTGGCRRSGHSPSATPATSSRWRSMPEERRKSDRELLGLYLDALRAAGGADIAFDRASSVCTGSKRVTPLSPPSWPSCRPTAGDSWPSALPCGGTRNWPSTGPRCGRRHACGRRFLSACVPLISWSPGAVDFWRLGRATFRRSIREPKCYRSRGRKYVSIAASRQYWGLCGDGKV